MKFLYIDKIKSITNQKIVAYHDSKNNEDWEFVETAAQLCSLHVRWLLNCNKHSFLLKVNRFSLNENKAGNINLKGELWGRSSDSFKYKFYGFVNNIELFSGELVIGAVSFNHNFNKEKIKKHYKGILKCLMKGIKGN